MRAHSCAWVSVVGVGSHLLWDSASAASTRGAAAKERWAYSAAQSTLLPRDGRGRDGRAGCTVGAAAAAAAAAAVGPRRGGGPAGGSCCPPFVEELEGPE